MWIKGGSQVTTVSPLRPIRGRREDWERDCKIEKEKEVLLDWDLGSLLLSLLYCSFLGFGSMVFGVLGWLLQRQGKPSHFHILCWVWCRIANCIGCTVICIDIVIKFFVSSVFLCFVSSMLQEHVVAVLRACMSDLDGTTAHRFLALLSLSLHSSVQGPVVPPYFPTREQNITTT